MGILVVVVASALNSVYKMVDQGFILTNKLYFFHGKKKKKKDSYQRSNLNIAFQAFSARLLDQWV